MTTATDLWLLSALLVLTTITLAVILNAGTEWLERDRDTATNASAPGVDSAASEKRKHIERFVYRHHRVFGVAILVGSMLYLGLIAHNGLLWPDDAGPVIGVALPILTLVHLALLPFGAVMLLRPSLLKRLEAASNRWIEWEGRTLSRAVRILVALYCLAALAVLIAERIRGL